MRGSNKQASGSSLLFGSRQSKVLPKTEEIKDWNLKPDRELLNTIWNNQKPFPFKCDEECMDHKLEDEQHLDVVFRSEPLFSRGEGDDPEVRICIVANKMPDGPDGFSAMIHYLERSNDSNSSDYEETFFAAKNLDDIEVSTKVVTDLSTAVVQANSKYLEYVHGGERLYGTWVPEGKLKMVTREDVIEAIKQRA